MLIPEARNDKDCQSFLMYQNKENPREFIFYELWEDEEVVKRYRKKLIEILGPSFSGYEFPDRFNEFIEKDEDLI